MVGCYPIHVLAFHTLSQQYPAEWKTTTADCSKGTGRKTCGDPEKPATLICSRK